jgi:hypothetical protein
MAQKTINIPLAETPADLSVAQLTFVLDNKPLIEKWLKAVSVYALGKAVSVPGSVPGWTTAPGHRTRGWLDEAAAVRVMGRLGINDMYIRTLKTVPQVETAIGEEAMAVHEGEAWLWTPGKPKLVRGFAPPPDPLEPNW